jgi:DNA-binding SARP family transcriptional activator
VLTLQLIGQPTLLVPGSAALPLERKDAALLAVLALDGPTARDTLAALLWPEVPLKTANVSLRQRVFRLRRRTGNDLMRTGDVLALAEDIAIDGLRDASASSDSAPEPPTGDLLGSYSYSDCGPLADWVRTQREHWRARRRDVLTAAAARHEAAGELARAIDLTQRLIAADGLNEHAQRRLIRLHYLRGDRAAAIAAFEQFEQLLKDELGARPDPETIELVRTIEHAQSVVPARRAVVPAALRRPPRLIGRETQLAALADAWIDDRVFLLVGEAGLGKTRLLQELATMHAAAVLVQARPGDGAVPFALLARVLRAVQEAARGAALPEDEGTRRELARVLPELGVGRVIGAEGQRLLLQRSVEALLRQAHAHGVAALLIDDLHFADAASLEMMQGLVDADGLTGLRWGFAQRPGEGGPATDALARALEETQRLQRVALAPLDAAQMQALIESLRVQEIDAARWAAPLVRHTGGNPLFALETLKDLVLSGVTQAATAGALPQPVTVGTLIERRLRQLSPPAIALARVAAIAGVDFSIELAEHVLKTPALALADAWAELEAAQVLVGAAFAHDLVYEATLRTVPQEIARHTHAAVGEWLQSRADEPARVAAHWRAAERWAEAAAQFNAAAVRARQTSRLVEARNLWDEAIACHARSGDRHARFDAELRRIDVLLFTDGIEAARGTAQRLRNEAADAREQIVALTIDAQTRLIAGEWQAAIDEARAAVELAAGLSEPALAIDCQRQIGVALSQLGQAAAAVEHMRATEPLVRAHGTTAQRYEHLSALAYALNAADQPRASAQALETACALAQENGDLAEVMACTSNLAGAVSALGRIDEALRLARRAHALNDRLGDVVGLQPTVNLMNVGMFASHVGEYRDALRALEQALDGLRRAGSRMWIGTAENHLAALWITLGQPARAGQLLASDAAEGNPSTRSRRQMLIGRIERLRGEDPRQRLTQALADLAALAKPRLQFGLQLELSRGLPAVEALALLRTVQRAAAAIEFEGVVLYALMREVDVLTSIDPDHAATLATQTIARTVDCWPMDGHLPELWLVCARALAAAGRRTEANDVARRGQAWIEAAARDHIDAPLRQAFLERNPIHAQLRAWRPRRSAR